MRPGVEISGNVTRREEMHPDGRLCRVAWFRNSAGVWIVNVYRDGKVIRKGRGSSLPGARNSAGLRGEPSNA